MIAPSRPETPAVDTPHAERRNSLPTYRQLVTSACWVCAPALAFFLLQGKLWPAVSVGIGLALSVTVCGLLYLFVARGMDYFVAGVRGTSGAQKNGSTLQFALLLPAKFLLVGVLGWALLTLHSINYLAVLVGFGLAQAAITFTAAKHFTKR